jgi:gentisate 1,2-dioxygenase
MDIVKQRADPGVERAQYYARIEHHHLAPLWESLHTLVPRQPQPKCAPAIWRYDDVRPLVLQAGALISAEEAVRRVLVLENPGLPGAASITSSLYAGLQLLLPGEIAPSHRHTQSALRFIVEGSGAWTSVDGERATMSPGDFIITPSWTWHGHGNASVDDGGEPVIWLDGLDIPLTRFLDAGFAETAATDGQAPMRPEGDTFARFGQNMAPVRHQPKSQASPVFCYPFDRTKDALGRLLRSGPVDAWDGVKLRYINPATGGWPMPTMATFMQLLPSGFEGRAYRATDATVFSVVSGRGTAVIGTTRYDFAPRDVFVVPSWTPLRLSAEEEATLFSFSDRPVQVALDLLREQRD